MTESRRRSIAKTLSWRMVATVITVSVAWVVTGTLKVAAAVGIADTVIKLAAYYAHERAWDRVSFGRQAKLVKSERSAEGEY